MRKAQFETIYDAAVYRRNHGGWLFVSDHNNAYWFDASYYTPSMIMLDKMISGFNGQLVCDNRYLKNCHAS